MSVTTKCYGEVKTWKSKAEAIKYFTEAMFGCDPGTSECARYTTILSKLRSGETMATDDEDDYENDDFESLVAQFEKKETKKNKPRKVAFVAVCLNYELKIHVFEDYATAKKAYDKIKEKYESYPSFFEKKLTKKNLQFQVDDNCGPSVMINETSVIPKGVVLKIK